MVPEVKLKLKLRGLNFFSSEKIFIFNGDYKKIISFYVTKKMKEILVLANLGTKNLRVSFEKVGTRSRRA